MTPIQQQSLSELRAFFQSNWNAASAEKVIAIVTRAIQEREEAQCELDKTLAKVALLEAECARLDRLNKMD